MSHDTRSLEDILTDYCMDNWFLFPVRAETKIPAIKDNLNQASNNINQLLKWANRFPGCLWGLSLAKSKLVAVDIDTRNGGMEYWKELIAANGEPETLTARTGSGGLHYVFKDEKEIRYRGKIKHKDRSKSGIDVKHNGYIVIYPSLHPTSGNQYVWTNTLSPSSAPAWIKARIEKPKESTKESSTYKVGDGFFEKIVEQLREKEFGYEEWNKFGMALHSWDNGPKGLDLFIHLTEGVNWKEGDSQSAQSKWESYTKGGGIGEGTLVRLARELGCVIPNRHREEDFAAFDEIEFDPIAEELDAPPAWTEDDQGRQITVHTDFAVKSINEMGFAIMEGDIDGQIIKTFTDKNDVPCVRLLRNENFKNVLKKYFVKWYKTMASGERRAQYTPACDKWLQSELRKTYEKIVFKEKGGPNEYNLGGKISFPRKKGDPKLFEYLCTDIMANGNKKKGKYLIQWCARIVQRPWDKCSVVPVVIGEQGTGKGLLFDTIMGQILGHWYNKVTTAETLKEKFNVEQSKKFFTFIDEGTWKGDHKEAAILKGLTGSRTIIVEEKFGGRYPLDNPSAYAIASNNTDAVKVETGNRRFLIFKVSDQHAQDEEFFNNFFDWLANHQGLEIIYDYLMSVDLTGFNSQVFPKELDTDGFASKLSSFGEVAQFWWNLLFEEPQKCFIGGRYVGKVQIFQMYREYVKETGGFSRGGGIKAFWYESQRFLKILREPHRDQRIRFGENGSTQRERVFAAMPNELAKSLCEHFNIVIPKHFDISDFLRPDAFKTDEPERDIRATDDFATH